MSSPPEADHEARLGNELRKSPHRLLLRQLRRHHGQLHTLPAAWRDFLDAVNEAYWQFDSDRGMLERSLELSSQELLETNSGMRSMVQELERSLSLLQATLDSTADGILVVDQAGRMVAFNHKFAQMWRLPEEILGSHDDDQALAHVADQLVDPDAFIAKVRELYKQPEDESHDVIDFHDGRCFERYSKPQRIGGKSVGRVWSFRDITARKRAEAMIRHRAYHDDLTDLPNRRLFKDRLRKAIGQAQRTGCMIATFFLDIDRFNTINDTLGHAAGDQLLKELAQRLRRRRRSGDTLARLGGDEFLALVQDLHQPEDAAQVAERWLAVLRPPVRLGGHEIHVTASIGISFYPHDGSDVDTLIKNADVAMYRAKAQGRDTYRIYAPEMNARAFEFLMLENRMRRALEREEFVLHYQPQIDAKSGHVTGFEALVRWEQADGLVPPSDFISVAEDTGQILALGEWVLRTACRQGRAWLDGGGGSSPRDTALRETALRETALRDPPLRLAVNLSALEFHRPGFLRTITRTLADTGFDPGSLELELTESAIMQDAERGVESLRKLREMGVRIAIDDFGTGHSSLAYLKSLPIDTLKIDQSFIRDCRDDPKDGAIVAAIIQMAHSLELSVVAEGVETEEQMEFLRSEGCDQMQGFFFSPPLEVEELESIVASRRLPR